MFSLTLINMIFMAIAFLMVHGNTMCQNACFENTRVLKACLKTCREGGSRQDSVQFLARVEACVRDTGHSYSWAECWADSAVEVDRPISMMDRGRFAVSDVHAKVSESYTDGVSTLKYTFGVFDAAYCPADGSYVEVSGINPATTRLPSDLDSTADVLYLTNPIVHWGDEVASLAFSDNVTRDLAIKKGKCYMVANPPNRKRPARCHYPITTMSTVCAAWDSECRPRGSVGQIGKNLFVTAESVAKGAAGVSCFAASYDLKFKQVGDSQIWVAYADPYAANLPVVGFPKQQMPPRIHCYGIDTKGSLVLSIFDVTNRRIGRPDDVVLTLKSNEEVPVGAICMPFELENLLLEAELTSPVIVTSYSYMTGYKVDRLTVQTPEE